VGPLTQPDRLAHNLGVPVRTLHIDPTAPHIDGDAFVRAEQCIALLQRRLIKPTSRGGPGSEVSLTQYHALSLLAARGSASVSELKTLLGFAQSTTSALVQKLRKLGLVEKEKHRADHRVALVVPLPKGLRVVQQFRKNAEQNLSALAKSVGEQALRDLFVALEQAAVATAALEHAGSPPIRKKPPPVAVVAKAPRARRGPRLPVRHQP
jgi:DNA-binding MarR family transcriptional regulator